MDVERFRRAIAGYRRGQVIEITQRGMHVSGYVSIWYFESVDFDSSEPYISLFDLKAKGKYKRLRRYEIYGRQDVPLERIISFRKLGVKSRSSRD